MSDTAIHTTRETNVIMDSTNTVKNARASMKMASSCTGRQTEPTINFTPYTWGT